MKKMNLHFVVVLLVLVSIVGCKKDPVDPNESELITTVRVKLTEKVSGVQSMFEFKDLDGVGGAAPSKFDEIMLTKGKVYDCTLQLLNESENPADDITLEVFAEGIDHQIYLTPTNALAVVSNYSLDSKGLPLGITSTWTAAAAAGTGTLNVTLKHKPGVKAAGDPVSKGDTDISIDFKLSVK
ncbi:MAG: hypothetical protein ACK5GP_09845 [bacterium]|jgi:hypothetical protein